MLATILVALWVLGAGTGTQDTPSPEAREILRLEEVWNQAHLRGDVSTIDRLCADDLVVTVPGMPRMSKADILGFWQSGRARMTRYDTTNVQVAVHGETAVATGQLARTRDFGGRVASDAWQFTKTYSKEQGRWVLVAYHASDAPR